MQSGLIVSCFRWRAAKATASSKPGRPRAEHMLTLSTLDALELVRAIAALLSAFLSSLNTLPYTLNKCGAVCPSADPGVNWKYMRCQTLKYDFAPLLFNSQLDDGTSMLSELWETLSALVLMQNVASATKILVMKHAMPATFLIRYACSAPALPFTNY